MQPALVSKFAGAVPRYTSYPTAPHFRPDVDDTTYARWLSGIDAARPVSLYLHIPFCDSLCWYCGCNTKMVARYDPVHNYVDTLLAEIALVASKLRERLAVSHIHFGGGSPSILAPSDIERISAALHTSYDIATDAEIAIEIDPRYIDQARITAFANIGVTRVSFGVQDFDPRVQTAINRHQTYEQTAAAVTACREAGMRSINIDLVYGLPHQTGNSVAGTIARVIELDPDRIALFGYAHLPARLPHQRLIDEGTLPVSAERFAQADLAAALLTDAGYVRIGLDHFAKPNDSLACRPVQRNFQGYTSDTAETLLAFGASAIGRLPKGYVQNSVPAGEYQRRIREGRLATARGVTLTDDDRARGYLINTLMSNLHVSRSELLRRHRASAKPLIAEAESLARTDSDGLFAATPEGFHVTERGRPFVRSICSCFDAYLAADANSYSQGV